MYTTFCGRYIYNKNTMNEGVRLMMSYTHSHLIVCFAISAAAVRGAIVARASSNPSRVPMTIN